MWLGPRSLARVLEGRQCVTPCTLVDIDVRDFAFAVLLHSLVNEHKLHALVLKWMSHVSEPIREKQAYLPKPSLFATTFAEEGPVKDIAWDGMG